MKIKVAVVYGLGIGCHQETMLAYKLAGAEPELIHFNQLGAERQRLETDFKVINICGGFLHGDILGSAMCAVNELRHQQSVTDFLYDFASKKIGVIYGQCNGFQLLVKSGLLPATANTAADREQEVTLDENQGGVYRVDHVWHKVQSEHFAFKGLDAPFKLWCRHGEGRIKFGAQTSESEISQHILLKYYDHKSEQVAVSYPANPNGSQAAIAGLQSADGQIFGQMAHPEVSCLQYSDPDWYLEKEKQKTNHHAFAEPVGLKIFKNIVNHLS